MVGNWKRAGPVLAAILFAATGCVTKIEPGAVTGSKSDGIVKFGFEYGELERPKIDWEKVRVKAVDRCRGWGYKDAEKFDSGVRACMATSQYGCLRYQVLVTYQCK